MGGGIGREEHPLAWKPGGDELLDPGAAVGDQRVELRQEPPARLGKQPRQRARQGAAKGGAPNPQPITGQAARMHPAQRRIGRCIARVGLHHQHIRVPVLQPIHQAELPDQQQRAPAQVHISGRNVLGITQLTGFAQRLVHHRFARKDRQPARAGARQGIEKRGAVGRKYALLKAKTVRDDGGHKAVCLGSNKRRKWVR